MKKIKCRGITSNGCNCKNTKLLNCSTNFKWFCYHHIYQRKEEPEKDDICILCGESFKNSKKHVIEIKHINSTNCKHFLHKTCYRNWIHSGEYKSTCPFCRQDIYYPESITKTFGKLKPYGIKFDKIMEVFEITRKYREMGIEKLNNYTEYKNHNIDICTHFFLRQLEIVISSKLYGTYQVIQNKRVRKPNFFLNKLKLCLDELPRRSRETFKMTLKNQEKILMLSHLVILGFPTPFKTTVAFFLIDLFEKNKRYKFGHKIVITTMIGAFQMVIEHMNRYNYNIIILKSKLVDMYNLLKENLWLIERSQSFLKTILKKNEEFHRLGYFNNQTFNHYKETFEVYIKE